MLIYITEILLSLLTLFSYALLLRIIMELLIFLNVIPMHIVFFQRLYMLLTSITEPLLAPIKNILPNFGMMDFSPLIVFILIDLLKTLLIHAASYTL